MKILVMDCAEKAVGSAFLLLIFSEERRFHAGLRIATEPKVLYEFGPFPVDPEKQALLRDDHPVAISPKVFESLLILVRQREVVSKDDLMKALWPDAFVEEANLSQNIFMLRKAFGNIAEDRRYIMTLPGKAIVS